MHIHLWTFPDQLVTAKNEVNRRSASWRISGASRRITTHPRYHLFYPFFVSSRSPSKPSRVPNTALSRSLWVARPWPSNSFKRMAPTAAPQEPVACALSDDWLQQLFMHHELWSNLTAAISPCFSDVCGYSCKDVQTLRLTVRSCSSLHCHCLTDTHRNSKKQSPIILRYSSIGFYSRTTFTPYTPSLSNAHSRGECFGPRSRKTLVQKPNWMSKTQASL